MKHKLLESLTLGLLTLGFLSPVLLVSGGLWYHPSSPSLRSSMPLNSVSHQTITTETVRTNVSESAAPSVYAARSPVLLCPHTSASPHSLQYSLQPIQVMTQLLLGSLISAPLSFFLGIICHKHYCIYRNAQHHQRVAFLERLWQQSIRP
ncbi:MAG: hypothetical protein IGS38_17595 [Synechococcales cyanobacterium M58_A2018_015]|jgi:hypothetical protein|nr:hypothetical protein [Synechococcales cyanobacterium M58_A2018_015]